MAEKRYIGLGKESEYGVAVAATRYAESVETIKSDQGWIVPVPISKRSYQKRNLGPFRVGGNIGPFDVEPENIIGELLLGVLGSVSTVNKGNGAYAHTFAPADSLPSWTTRIGAELTERVLAGLLINSLRLNFEHGKNLMATAGMVGAPVIEADAALATPTLSPLQAFVYHQASVEIEAVEKNALVYAGEININNHIPVEKGNLQDRFFNTKRYGQIEAIGKLSMYFDNTTERARFLAGTEFALVTSFTGPVIAGEDTYALQLTLHACHYERDLAPHVVPQSEPLVLNAPFRGYYDPSASKEIEAILQNTITSY